jgi:hypothetical protein
MPEIRQYTEAFSLLDTDAFVIDRLGIGSMYIEAENAFEGAYDIAMGFPGQPPVSAVFLAFVAVRVFTIPSPGDPVVPPQPAPPVSQFRCINAPSGGSVTFSVAVNGVGVGTITFTNGATTGTYTWPADVVFAAGDLMTISSPANVFSMSDITMTFAGLR